MGQQDIMWLACVSDLGQRIKRSVRDKAYFTPGKQDSRDLASIMLLNPTLLFTFTRPWAKMTWFICKQIHGWFISTYV